MRHDHTVVLMLMQYTHLITSSLLALCVLTVRTAGGFHYMWVLHQKSEMYLNILKSQMHISYPLVLKS